MARIKTLVWDFDGTQGRNLEALVNLGHRLSQKYVGFDFTAEDVEYFRSLSAKEIAKAFFTGVVPSKKGHQNSQGYLAKLVPNFRLQWKLAVSLPRILKEGVDEFKEMHETIQPYDGIVDIIKELSAQDYENITLSSNRKETIHNIYNNPSWNLHCVEVYHCTTFLGFPSLFGKANELKKIMKERGLRKSRGNVYSGDSFNGYQRGLWKYDSDKVLGIADEVRDYHAFHNLGIRMLCATWGLNNEAAFLNAGVDPRYIVDNPRQIPEKIKELEAA